MAPENRRKAFIWYISFKEFGWKLGMEEYWLPLAAAKTSWAKKVPGGWSALTRRLLRSLFVDQKIATVGIQIFERVYVHFYALIADEEALSAVWHLKGSSGTSPCAVACSVVAKPVRTDVESGIPSLAERSVNIVNITCSEVSKMGIKTDNDVWPLVDDLIRQKAILRPKEFENLESCKGFKYHPEAILFDHELRTFVLPATCNRFDAMHVIFPMVYWVWKSCSSCELPRKRMGRISKK